MIFVRDAHIIKQETKLPLYVVRGNNDYNDENTPWKLLIRIKDHKILLTHGHQEVGWSSDNLIYAAKEAGADMVMYMAIPTFTIMRR